MREKMPLKQRAAAGLVSYGLAMVLPCTSTIEMAALAGYDFIRLDCEQAMFSTEELRQLLQTARLIGMPCQVRVSDLTGITPLLGQEPSGIMIPHVESILEVKEAVEYCRFAPVGKRGMDGNTRRMRCEGMKRAEYMKYSAETMDLIVQIESKKALENADGIIQVPGIDMIATGRADLSQELGVPGQKDHPDVVNAENEIIRKTLENKKFPIITAGSPKRVQELYEMGVRCFVVGKDENLLEQGIRKNLATMKGDQKWA